LPSCDCDFGEAVVWLDVVVVFFEVVVVDVEVVLPPRPPSAGSNCDVVEGEEVAAAILLVVVDADCA
jgi:hypothetical protein